MGRICAVKHCHNSEIRLKQYRKSHPGRTDPFTLFPFPKDEERKLEWQKQIYRRIDDKGTLWKPNSQSRACSNHFVDGRPTLEHPSPTIDLGHPYSKHNAIAVNRARLKECGNDGDKEETTCVETASCSARESVAADTEHSSTVDQNYAPECEASVKPSLKKTHKRLQSQIKAAKRKYSGYKKNYNIQLYRKFVSTDKSAKFYTGLPSTAVFWSLYR